MLRALRKYQTAGQFFSAADKQEIITLAASIPTRLRCSTLVEQNEEHILNTVIAALKRTYADYPNYQPQAWAKSYRDIGLVLRYNVQAMIHDDRRWLDESLLFWLRTILQAFIFHSPNFVRDTYTLLLQACQETLPPAEFALLKPFLERNIEVLSDFPDEFFMGQERPSLGRSALT